MPRSYSLDSNEYANYWLGADMFTATVVQNGVVYEATSPGKSYHSEWSLTFRPVQPSIELSRFLEKVSPAPFHHHISLSLSLPLSLSFFLALSFSLRIDQRETTGKTSTGNSKSIPDAFKSFRGSLSQHSPRNGLTELHFSRVGIASGGWRQALTLTQTMDPSIALHFDYWFHLVSFVCVCVCVVFVFFWSILSI